MGAQSRWAGLLAGFLLALSLVACLPGVQQTTAPPPDTPADEVFVGMLRSIEERKVERFMASVDPSCVPPSDRLWGELNDYLNRAELIEYIVTVERRVALQNGGVTYVFSWQRKHDSKADGSTVNAGGRSEWTFAQRPGEPPMLIQVTGQPLF